MEGFPLIMLREFVREACFGGELCTYTFYHQNTFLDVFRKNSRNVVSKNSSMVIPLLANQNLMPMLVGTIKLGIAYFMMSTKN